MSHNIISICLILATALHYLLAATGDLPITKATQLINNAADVKDDDKDPCVKYDVDGCSIPFGLPFFYKDLFTHSCNRHDVCYACGVDYNLTRHDCDDSFKQSMDAACEHQYKSAKIPTSSPRGVKRDLELTTISESSNKGEFLAKVRSQKQQFDDIFLEHFPEEVLATIETPAQLEDILDTIKSDVIQKWHSAVFGQNAAPLATRSDNLTLSGSTTRLYGPKTISSPVFRMKIFDDTHTKRRILSNEIELLNCYFFADAYYGAVRVFSESHFEQKAEFYCHQDFVPKCLPH